MRAPEPLPGVGGAERTPSRATRSLDSTRRESSPLLFGLVLAWTFVHFVALTQRIGLAASIRIEALLGLACLAAAVFTLMKDPLPVGAGRPVVIAFLAFLVLEVLQIPFAMDTHSAWFAFNEWVVPYTIFALFVAVLLRSPRQVTLFLAVYLLSLFYIYQEAVRGLISGSLVWYNQGIMRLHGGVDKYRHPNGLSLVALACLPFLYYMRNVWTRRWMQLAMLACLGLATLCIINSGSRAGYVGVVSGIFCIWLVSRHRLRNSLLLGVLVVVAALAVPDQYQARFRTIGGEEIQGSSQDARLTLMIDAWEIFLDYPYGIGLDSFIKVRLDKFPDRKGQDVHCLYLQVLTHLGLQGLLLFGWLIVTLFQCQERSLRSVMSAAGGLRQGVREGEIPGDRHVARFLRDLRALEMAIRGVRFFMVMMLFNGIFAHTIYTVIWSFIVGLSLATAANAANLTEVTARFWLRHRHEQELLAAEGEAAGLPG